MVTSPFGGEYLTILLVVIGVQCLVSGGMGFWMGKAGTQIGCGTYAVVFLILGGIPGILFFVLGRTIGASAQGEQSGYQSMGPPEQYMQPQAWHGPPSRQVEPPPQQHQALPSFRTPDRPVGWSPDASDPSVQWYWDGQTWAGRMRWNGAQWESF